MEQVERWANFVKTHPREEWMKHLKPFIDGQIKKANDFFKELLKTKEGREKIRLIKKI
jgi:hypothetical protein